MAYKGLILAKHRPRPKLNSISFIVHYKSILDANRPGFQHVVLLLSVEAVQLVQVSSQLEHPCCPAITLLSATTAILHKVVIIILPLTIQDTLAKVW